MLSLCVEKHLLGGDVNNCISFSPDAGFLHFYDLRIVTNFKIFVLSCLNLVLFRLYVSEPVGGNILYVVRAET